MRPVIRTKDNAGRAIVKVPLGRHGERHAVLFEEDFERLCAAGVGTSWFVSRNGSGQEYVRAFCRGATGDQITVARAILGAGRRSNVRYLTGDRTNLRRWNLELAKGNGRRNDTGLARAHAGAVKAA